MLLLATILTATSRIVFSGCMALRTRRILRPFPASRFRGTCFLQLLCPRCYLFYQLVTRHVSFSVELSSNASPQMFDLTLSMTTPWTPSPYLSVLMRSTRVAFPPPPPSTTSILHQLIIPFLSFKRSQGSPTPWSSHPPSICQSFCLTPF